MSKKVIDIIIVETSSVVYEGLVTVLTNSGHSFHFHHAESFAKLQQIHARVHPDIVLLNPVLIQNLVKDFQSVKMEWTSVRWVSIIYTLVDQHLFSLFDAVIQINDTPDKIMNILQKLLLSDQPAESKTQQETLSQREIEVLKLLVEGCANKEIADNLNISTNTVISHRKNISQKTGIKSVSGLTIYAVVNHIVALESFSD